MNMKTNITILAASLLFCACSSDNEGQQEDLVPITLTATMIVDCPLATRTTSTDLQSSQFTSGQTFYAYFTSSSVVPQSTVFTADGSGGATPANQPYFKLSGTTTDVRAYYPSTVTEATTSFVVEADQTTDASYRNSDLMYASATIPKVYPTSTGELAFAHKMAKVRVQTVNNGSSVKTITLKSVKRQVPFTASTGAVGVATVSGATDVTMFDHAGQTSDIDCVALIPPQTMTSGTTLIEVTTVLHSSSPLTYQLPANISFASGMQYIFTVNVHEESLIVSCNVTAWGTGNTASTVVNFMRPTLPIEYVAPYNMQTATTMATDNLPSHSMYFYWGSNSITRSANMTKFTNGTALSGYHLPSKAEWCSVIAPYHAGSSDSSMGGSSSQRITYKRGSSSNMSETVAWGVTNNNGTYTYDVNQVFYNDYNCPNDAAHTYIGYGLRFKEMSGSIYVNGQYTCGYRYEYKTADASVGGGASLTIMVKWVGQNQDVTISTVSDESWWISPDFTVVIPACGNKGTDASNYAAGSYSSADDRNEGYYWTTTVSTASSDRAFNVYFNTTDVGCNRSSDPRWAFPVRLFRDK